MNACLRATFASPAVATFTALILFQGFHELEHIAQVIQRYVLGISNGNGLFGSVVDVEPVHFVYNSGYLLLLAATYVGLGLSRDGAARRGGLVYGLTSFALVFQSWHEIEHVFKLAQYFELGVNGTGGVFGVGPGSIRPLVPIPLLHFAYNTVAYAPALTAFVILIRRARRTSTATSATSVLQSPARGRAPSSAG
jgi:hypothetical protein